MSNYSGLGHIPLHSAPFFTKSHIQGLHGCSSSTSDTNANHKPRLSVTNPMNLGFGKPGPSRGQRGERGLFLSLHKRIPGSERFHMSLSCFCFHSLNQTLPQSFRSDCKNQRNFYNVFFHLLLSVLCWQNTYAQDSRLVLISFSSQQRPFLLAALRMPGNNYREQMPFLETQLRLHGAQTLPWFRIPG